MTSRTELIKQVGGLKTVIQIGKQGLTEGVLEEIKKHLKKHKLIKIKCLRYYVDSVEVEGNNKAKMSFISNEIITSTSAELIQIRGFTIAIYNGNSS